MSSTRQPDRPDLPPRSAEPESGADDVEVVRIEALDEEKAHQIIEEYESESPTRPLGGVWRWLAGALAAALAIYALYWTQFSIATHPYRASFLLLVLALTFLLYPAVSGGSARPTPRRLGIRLGVALVLIVAIAGWAREFESARNLALAALALLVFALYPALKPLFADRPDLLDAPPALLGAIATGYVAARATERWAADRLGLAGATWQLTAVALAVVASAVLYVVLRRDGAGRDRIAVYDLQLALMAAISLVYLVLHYQEALQRVTRPTTTELLLGGLLILLVLEATRRTTGWVLSVTALVFLLYAYYGPYMPSPFDHRGYPLRRIIGQNYLTLEGMFGVPLDVAATFIVLFTIYGAMLEYSGAGKFFLDWSFAAFGKSRSGTGPGRTVTAAGFLLGTVSGSGVATTVTLASLAWPMLRRAGFHPNTAGGILSAAGIGALLSPPTLGAAAFLIAEYLEVSYLRVLVYATIPTLLYYLSCLLMMEADSRRMHTRGVAVETPPLRELTARYGYHFSSLFVIVILMALGLTAFMAVFLSIVLAFALSFIRPETRMTSLRALIPGAALTAVLFVWTLVRQAGRIFGGFDPLSWGSWKGMLVSLSLAVAPPAFWGMMLTVAIVTALALRNWWQRRRGAAPLVPSAAGAAATGVGTAGYDSTAERGEQGADTRLLQALESGGKGVLSVAATTATAGVIVSVVTLTGLGLKIAGIIVDLSGGIKFLTILFAALAVWVLGLAVPVTASYIIAAVMIVPALADPRFGVGVVPAAAHMFIFYYAVLADVSPPTALAPFAASAITGGNPFRTTMMAWKYCLPAFLVPFMFTLSPEGESLLLIGAPLTIAWTFLTACVAVAALAIAFGGWIVRQATLLERVLAGLGGLALLYADFRTDVAGFALLLIAGILHLVRLRLATAPAASEAA